MKFMDFYIIFSISGNFGLTHSHVWCNHNLYIGIIISPHIDDTQSTAYN